MIKQNNRLIGFLAILLVPIIILLLMTVKPLLALGSGEEIRLQTKPVDPRDLFYGDYVNLSYEIEDVSKEQIDANLVKKAQKTDYGSIKMYAILKKDGDVYVLDRVTAEKPKGKIYLNGEIYSYNDWSDNKKTNFTYEASYNLDRYYVPENTGKSLEDGSRKGEVIAHLKVRNGYGILTDLEIK